MEPASRLWNLNTKIAWSVSWPGLPVAMWLKREMGNWGHFDWSHDSPKKEKKKKEQEKKEQNNNSNKQANKQTNKQRRRRRKVMTTGVIMAAFDH